MVNPKAPQESIEEGLSEEWAKKILTHFCSCLIDWGGDPGTEEYRIAKVRRIFFGIGGDDEDIVIVMPVDLEGCTVGFDIMRFMKLFEPSAGCNFDEMDGPTVNFNGELVGRKGQVWIKIYSNEHGPSMPDRYLPMSKKFFIKDL